MSANCRISEFGDGLKVVATTEVSTFVKMLIALFFGVAFFGVTRVFFGYWSALIAPVVAGLTFLSKMGGQVELRATKVELVATGNLGRRGGRLTRVVCSGDVRGLEFRDLAGSRRGLYAVTNKTAHCILPFLDYEQTMEVIHAIKEKFPGLAEAWGAESASTSDFLTLGLGRVK